MGKHKQRGSNMRTMVINRGLPASGKTTWTLEQLKKEPDRWVRINKDGIRRMLIGDTWSANIEDLVHAISESNLKAAILEGRDVIVDNTHLTQKSVNKLHKIASELGNILVIERVFAVPAIECLKRNAARSGVERVPENIMESMIKGAGLDKHGYRHMQSVETYYEPHATASAPKIEPGLPSAIICDLDGTLAIINGRDPYDASRCDEVDLPNHPVIETVKAMHAKGHRIIYMSGRDSKYREATIRFIEKHVFTSEVVYHEDDKGADVVVTPVPYELHMRVEGDMRKDSIVKRELFDAHVAGKFNVFFVLDDRNQVVRLWRNELGLTTFQVNDGDF